MVLTLEGKRKRVSIAVDIILLLKIVLFQLFTVSGLYGESDQREFPLCQNPLFSIYILKGSSADASSSL